MRPYALVFFGLSLLLFVGCLSVDVFVVIVILSVFVVVVVVLMSADNSIEASRCLSLRKPTKTQGKTISERPRSFTVANFNC